MNGHALLSPSSSNRWLKCTKSARLEENIEAKESEYAKEGTLAHELAEILILYEIKEITKEEYKEKLEKIKKDELYKDEMYDYIITYVDYILQQIEKAKKNKEYCFTLIEKKLDLKEWVKGSFGTADAVIICENSAEIIDLKYGKGVEVKAKNNSQMMLYSLGVLNEFNLIYPIKEIKMTIIQPRLYNITSYKKSSESILEFGEKIKPIANLAYKGEGKLKAGEHCLFCKIKGSCVELAKKSKKIEKYKDKDLNKLSKEDLEEILTNLPTIKLWVKSVEEYILSLAVKKGVKFKDKKLVEGRSVRKYIKEDEIEKILTNNGYKEEEIIKKELKNITTLEKIIGKKKFNTLLGSYIIKEKGKLKLVDIDDKRQEYISAEEDFK